MLCLFRRLLIGGLLIGLGASAMGAPRVAVDIGPIHSIVARVMSGAGVPDLLLPPGASPHSYALRPSEAALLQNADIVVWIGPVLTPWMEASIDGLAASATVLTLADVAAATRLPARSGGAFEPDDDAGHGWQDPHMWLDPINASAFASAIADVLAGSDPENAAIYQANAAAFSDEITRLTDTIATELAPVRGAHFIVFHDAYQYFEARFGMPASGSILLQEGAAPSAARVAAIRDRLAEERVTCAFTEPQFEPKLLRTVVENTGVRIGVLDPVGAGLAPGPDLYPTLIERLGSALAGCLGGKDPTPPTRG